MISALIILRDTLSLCPVGAQVGQAAALAPPCASNAAPKFTLSPADTSPILYFLLGFQTLSQSVRRRPALFSALIA